MPVFSARDFADHEQVVFCTDRAAGLKAIIALHNTACGPALGGCRMHPYRTEDEALADVLRLSRGMTYKNAVSALPFGGGKAVIIGDPRSDKTEALLLAMGRCVDSLGGRYVTAEDVGTTVKDMDVLRRVTRFARGISDGAGNPSPATAYGVFMGIRAAVSHRLRRNSLGGLAVAVQGAGSVGSVLCEYLAKDGAHVIVADVNEIAVRRVVKAVGARPARPDEIVGVEADVFAPCALGAVFNDDTVPRLKAKIVAGAANNQLADPRHGHALHARGVLYAPDYVVNAGGVIDIACEGPDYSIDRVLKRVEGIYDTLTEILRRAASSGLPPFVVADRMAEERFVRA